jgi:hypothetical protein
VELQFCQRLRRLNLSRNRLSCLPEVLYRMSSVEVLDLSHNSFVSIDPAVRNLSHLRELNLDGNSVLRLPETLLEIPGLVSVRRAHLFCCRFIVGARLCAVCRCRCMARPWPVKTPPASTPARGAWCCASCCTHPTRTCAPSRSRQVRSVVSS